MESRIVLGIGLLILIYGFTIVNSVPVPVPDVLDIDKESELPIPLAQRSYQERHEPVSVVRIIILLLLFVGCIIGPVVTLLICCCPQIFPCKNLKNRRPGFGSCNWSDMTRYGYYRNRFYPQPPVIVTVNMPPQQYPPGQGAPLMQPPIIIQHSPAHGRGTSAGAIYSAAVYTSPSYPTNPAPQPQPQREMKQQSYNPNYSS